MLEVLIIAIIIGAIAFKASWRKCPHCTKQINVRSTHCRHCTQPTGWGRTMWNRRPSTSNWDKLAAKRLRRD